MPINEHHQRYLGLLLDHAAARRYPSHHMLARIEEMITDRETAEAYLNILLLEAEAVRYPSHHMLERAKDLIVRITVADEITRLEREAEQRRREAERELEAESDD